MSLDADVTFPACPPGIPGPQDNCVKVDVFRNQARGNPLPTFFGRLAVSRIRACRDRDGASRERGQHRVPEALGGRRPWQEFGDRGPGTAPTSTFDRYPTAKATILHRRPTSIFRRLKAAARATRSPRDRGRQFAIKMGPSGGNEISSGWFRTLDLPRADTTQLGNNTVQNNILTCNGLPSSFAGPTTVCPASIPNSWAETAYWAARGCYRVQTGATVGSTRNSIEALIALDAGRGLVERRHHRKSVRPAGG